MCTVYTGSDSDEDHGGLNVAGRHSEEPVPYPGIRSRRAPRDALFLTGFPHNSKVPDMLPNEIELHCKNTAKVLYRFVRLWTFRFHCLYR